ncbi:alpha/beta hydrolase [Streptomyces sp. BE20]|uniref:alpha/beta hydrolase n=1 Tax=Streptomyces sp. BE20 TaxID=3002525 RepID=UPI002E77C12C|nr:alpha/beta hydrolase [Streptomyces sp. BE20]MEE1821756.1 alpha/beta hydrolase [Streptomyces sp. BE20]
MDIAGLYNANLNNITTAKNAFDALATAFGQHVEAWQHEVADRLGASHWTGPTSAVAQGRVKDLGGQLRAARQELTFVSKALANAVEQFALAQSHLISALDDARNAKLDVAPDGRITWDNEPASPGFAGSGAETTAVAISNRITAALNEAAHADQEISARLNHLATNASNGTGLNAATVAQDLAAETAREQIPVAGTDPNSVKQWWSGLTPAQQQRFVHDHPDRIGNLDGIPAVARDGANRLTLQQAKLDLQAQLDHLGPEPPAKVAGMNGAVSNPAHDEWERRRALLQEQVIGVNAIEKRLMTKVDDKHPPTYLLGFDTKGNGHAIVAVNNPDTADNVSTYVPGTGARLGSIDSDIERSDRMVASASAAQNPHNPKTTSSITWVGYDAPQSIVPDATHDSYAKNAANSLHSFEAGLRTTHEGVPSNNTILAHSYGTTTVGYTMRDKGLPVDNVVLIASPGAGVERAGDLGVDPSRVFVAKGDIDNIDMAFPQTADKLASNGGNNVGTWYGIIQNPDHHLIHGRDPMIPDFGARTVPTSPETGHSDYWNENSSSLRAMGEIIAGKWNS